jgi:hypothetical protein
MQHKARKAGEKEFLRITVHASTAPKIHQDKTAEGGRNPLPAGASSFLDKDSLF